MKTIIIRDVEKAISGMGDAEQAAALSTTFTSRSIQAMLEKYFSQNIEQVF